MEEILPGVWHWTADHPNIRSRVSSHLLADSGTALDPLLPDEAHAEALTGAGRRLERVVLTNRHHLRHATRLRERLGVPILVPRPGLHEFEGRDVEVEAYDDGDELAPGVTAHVLGAISPDDFVVHARVGPGLLAFADGVVTHEGRLTFVPDALMDDPETVKRRTRERLRELLDLEFDALLFAHGAPMTSGGHAALRDFAG